MALVVKLLKIFIVTLVLLVAIATPIVPYVVKYVVINESQKLGLHTQLNDLTLAPLRGVAELDGLTIQFEDKPLLKLERASINLSWRALIGKTIGVEQISISGLELDLTYWTQLSETLASDANSSEQNASSEPWPLTIDNVELADWQITVPQMPTINIDAVGLQAVEWLNNRVNLTGSANLTVADSTLSSNFVIESSAQNVLAVFDPLSVNIQLQDIEKFAAELPVKLSGLLEFSSHLTIQRRADLTQVELSQFELAGSSIMIESQAQTPESYMLTLIDSWQVQLQQAQVELPAEQSPSWQLTEVNTHANGLTWYGMDNMSSQWQAVTLQASDINDESNLTAKLEQLKLEQGTLQWFPSGNAIQSLILAVPDIELQQTHLTQSTLTADSLNIAGAQIDIELKPKEPAEASLPNELPDATANPKPSTHTGNEIEQSKFPVTLNQITLTDPVTLMIKDGPSIAADIYHVKLNNASVSALSTAENQPPVKFELSGEIGQHGQFTSSGSGQFFQDPKQATLNAKFESIDLVPFSDIIESASGYGFNQGLWSSNIDLEINGQQLTGNVHNELQAVEFATSTDKADNKQSATSINLALSNLTDSQGNLELDVPLSGSLDSPQWKVTGVLGIITNKIINESMKSYLLTTFVPYSKLVSLAMLAGGKLFEVRFNDLTFAKSQLGLDEQSQLAATQLGEMLNQDADLQVTLCPISNSMIELNTQQPDETQRQQLNALAKDRNNDLIQWLNQTHGIAKNRLIPCAPSIDKSSTRPSRIALSIK